MKTKTRVITVAAMLSLVLVIGSCSKDNENAPPLPPESSMKFETAHFSDASKSSFHFGVAAFQVGLWNAIINVGMAVPVASFSYAIANDVPENVADNKWLWSYTFNADGKNFTANLYGTLNGDVVEWEMYISLDGVYNDFLWYRGQSRTDRTSGYWVLKKSPLENVDLLRIDWLYSPELNTGDVKYLNVEENGPENGGYVAYGNNATGTFSVFYDIYNKGKNELTEIEFDPKTTKGRINYPAEDKWYCWDENQQDAVCLE